MTADYPAKTEPVQEGMLNQNEIVSITLRGNSKAAVLAAIDKLTHNHPNSIYPVRITESKTGKRVTLKCALVILPLSEKETMDAEYDYTEGHAVATVEPADWIKRLNSEL